MQAGAVLCVVYAVIVGVSGFSLSFFCFLVRPPVWTMDYIFRGVTLREPPANQKRRRKHHSRNSFVFAEALGWLLATSSGPHTATVLQQLQYL